MDGMQGYGVPPEAVRSRAGGRIRVLASAVAVAFAVTLAVIIGQRLSDQAMAVLAGAVCGVGASIPTSLLIISVTRRRHERESTRPMQGLYPPVVVVQPPAQPGVSSARQPGYLPPYVPPARREFTVVGGEMEDVRYGGYQ
ncbi:MAG TPA: hypothetical protein ENI39_02550 [Anaerolineae bacterium]|nr:hypothetical protein [Anaerolineae bacterium]